MSEKGAFTTQTMTDHRSQNTEQTDTGQKDLLLSEEKEGKDEPGISRNTPPHPGFEDEREKQEDDKSFWGANIWNFDSVGSPSNMTAKYTPIVISRYFWTRKCGQETQAALVPKRAYRDPIHDQSYEETL